MFYEKAISSWRDGTAYGRTQLVVQYFQSVNGFTEPEVIRSLAGAASGNKKQQEQKTTSPFNWLNSFLELLKSPSDPFYAVIAYKNFKPVYE